MIWTTHRIFEDLALFGVEVDVVESSLWISIRLCTRFPSFILSFSAAVFCAFYTPVYALLLLVVCVICCVGLALV